MVSEQLERLTTPSTQPPPVSAAGGGGGGGGAVDTSSTAARSGPSSLAPTAAGLAASAKAGSASFQADLAETSSDQTATPRPPSTTPLPAGPASTDPSPASDPAAGAGAGDGSTPPATPSTNSTDAGANGGATASGIGTDAGGSHSAEGWASPEASEGGEVGAGGYLQAHRKSPEPDEGPGREVDQPEDNPVNSGPGLGLEQVGGGVGGWASERTQARFWLGVRPGKKAIASRDPLVNSLRSSALPRRVSNSVTATAEGSPRRNDRSSQVRASTHSETTPAHCLVTCVPCYPSPAS